MMKRRRHYTRCGIALLSAWSTNANAFHEKAGESQVGSFMFLCWTKLFFYRVATVANLPSAVVDEHFARCKLGVLVSAGAATC